MRCALVFAIVALLGGVARAEAAFDMEGWTLLGNTTSRKGTASFRSHARVDQLVVVVKRGKGHATGVSINKQAVEGSHSFRDGSRAWHLDLDALTSLRRIEVHFAEKRTKLQVQLFGRDSSVEVAPRTHRMHSTWSDAGWDALGKRHLDGRRSSESTTISTSASVTQLTVTASGADLAIRRLYVTFADGSTWVDDKSVFLGDGAREHRYQLPDYPQAVLGIRVTYQISSGDTCTVAFFGRDAVSAPVEDFGPTWDDDGWTLLGEDEVDLVDDEVVIDRDDSTWSMVAVVAIGDDVTLESIGVHLAGKSDKLQRADLGTRLSDGARTRVLEIAGKRRAIEKVRLTYKKHKLDASTRVQVYAR